MNTDDIIVQVTRCEIKHKLMPHTSVAIELRDPEKDSWAVKTEGGLCVNKDLVTDYEPQPSSRTEKWLKEFRFSKEEAQLTAALYVLKRYDAFVEFEAKRKRKDATNKD